MDKAVQASVPWLSVEAFPEKPKDADYGYLKKGRLVPCTQEELIRQCRVDDAFFPIQLVWHPEEPRLVPVQQAPFLLEAYVGRLRARLQTNLWMGVICLILNSLLLLAMWSSGGNASVFLFILFFCGILPVFQSTYGLRQLKKLQSGNDATNEIIYRYGAWINSRPVRFTWVILGVLIPIFGLELLRSVPVSVQAAGLDKHAVWQGQWWRLFTGPLMHGGVMHFIFNATALVGLGRTVELLTSRYHLALVLFIGIFSGSLFSLFLLPNTTSVGTSGGLLGLIGFLGILGWRRKKIMPPGFVKSVAINVALIAFMGIVAFALIDNAAHFGGLVAGIVLGILLVGKNETNFPLTCGPLLKIAGTFSLALIIGFACLTLDKMLHA